MTKLTLDGVSRACSFRWWFGVLESANEFGDFGGGLYSSRE